MKQRLTVEDLNQFSLEQKEKLRERWTPEVGDIVYVGGNWRVGTVIEVIGEGITVGTNGPGRTVKHMHKFILTPLFSIGQMIELLGDNTNDWGMHYEDTTCDWVVYIGYLSGEPKEKWVEDELCDALFAALKAVL